MQENPHHPAARRGTGRACGCLETHAGPLRAPGDVIEVVLPPKDTVVVPDVTA